MPSSLPSFRTALCLFPLAILASAPPAMAQFGPGAMGPVWHGGRTPGHDFPRDRNDNPDGSGKVDVARFVAPNLAPGTLGHGPIAVSSAQDAFSDPQDMAPFEAAVVDQLVHAGYQTAISDQQGGQVAELRLIRAEARPPEAPHKPVSGEMSMGVSNRGTMAGMAINVDLTKPKGALYATRLEARIRDRGSNAVLWEGRAEILTRQGDPHWDKQAIARKLATVLFDGFPNRSDGG